jgi:hypothetical protein
MISSCHYAVDGAPQIVLRFLHQTVSGVATVHGHGPRTSQFREGPVRKPHFGRGGSHHGSSGRRHRGRTPPRWYRGRRQGIVTVVTRLRVAPLTWSRCGGGPSEFLGLTREIIKRMQQKNRQKATVEMKT